MLIWLIYSHFSENNQLEGWLVETVDRLNSKNVFYLIICMLLTPANWLIEVFKWKKLTEPISQLTWQQASESVLAGLTLGIITPSRIGEYGGRLLHSNSDNRADFLFANLLGSIAQNIPNFLLGSLASLVFFNSFYLDSGYISASIAGLTCLLAIALALVYYRHEALIWTFSKTKKWLKVINIPTIKHHDFADLNYVLFLSFCRYLIFVFQYVLLLFFFGINVNLSQALVGVALIFLLQSGLPLPPIMSVLARGELALLVWSVYDSNKLTILFVPFTLWIINLLLPALIGGIVILKTNISKQFET